MNKIIPAAIIAAPLCAGSLFGGPVSATEVLSFGQSTPGANPIQGTEVNGVTTIIAVDAPIAVTSCFGCGPLNGPETFSMNAISTGPAVSFHNFVIQGFTGTFTIMNGSTDVLSGKFTDAIFGAGNSLVLSASDVIAGQSVVFTSGMPSILALGEPEAMSLSFADVQPIVGVRDGSIESFAASIAGTYSAVQASVPEPSTLPLLVMGLGGLAAWTLGRRRKK